MLLKPVIRAISFAGMTCLVTMSPVQAKELNFGIISTESSQNLRKLWDPFLADMSKKTGMRVKAFFAPDYAGIIQGMRFDKVDIAWYGNKSAMEAVDRANGEVIYQTVNADGSLGYWSLIVAHKDSPLHSVEDLLRDAKNLTFANGDPNSTSGFLVPGYYVFAQNNVDPNKAFKRVVTGNHEVNALSVANKQVDAGTFNTEGMDRLKVAHPDKAALLKEIWRSPLIPGDPIVWRKNLDDETKQKIKVFFDSYGDKPEELQKLKDLNWSKFKVSNNNQLLPIRQLEAFKKRSQLLANTALSEADKTQQVAKIDEELKKLEEAMKQVKQ